MYSGDAIEWTGKPDDDVQKSGLVDCTVAYCIKTGCGAAVVAGIACSWMGKKLAGISCTNCNWLEAVVAAATCIWGIW